MFHIEMRQGLQTVRALNLTQQELDARFLGPLLAGEEFASEGHYWAPRKTRIRIFEHPELKTFQLGMGRGWQSVERKGSDVTEVILDAARQSARTGKTVPLHPLP